MSRTFRTRIGPEFNEGARRLWTIIARSSQAAVTRRIACRPGQLTKWVYGDRRPSVEWAARIERELRIPARLWGEPSAMPFVPPAATAA